MLVALSCRCIWFVIEMTQQATPTKDFNTCVIDVLDFRRLLLEFIFCNGQHQECNAWSHTIVRRVASRIEEFSVRELRFDCVVTV